MAPRSGKARYRPQPWRIAVVTGLWLAATLAMLAGPPPAGSNRFLFIVDASAGMKPLDDGIRQSIFDLVYSGVRGRMTEGDTYGIWVVRDANNTSFPMEVWKQKFAVESAAKAALYVKDGGFRGKARLDLAIEDAARVIRAVGDLTVIIISDAATPLRGTPFDDEINAAFQRLAPEMRTAKATVNTTLAAQDGMIVGWAVNSPEFLIEFPSVPPRASKPAVASTATPAAPTSAAPVAPTPTRPPVAAAPLIITRETVEHERLVTKALASTQLANEPPIIQPPQTTSNSPAGPASIEAASATGVPGGTNAVARTAVPPPAESISDATGTAGAMEPVAAPPTNDAATVGAAPRMKTDAAAPGARAVEVQPTASVWRGNLLWAGGGAGLAILLLVSWAMRRERKNEPSLISRAAALERLRR